MPAREFHLTSEWRLEAPCDAVWREISEIVNWPAWWRAVKSVERLADGDANGVGAVHRLLWRTALPYDLAIETETVEVRPMSLIEGKSRGELSGLGRWTFSPDGDRTHLRYDWIVAVEKPWMIAMAPLLRSAFAWNHQKVMGWGEADLKARLR